MENLQRFDDYYFSICKETGGIEGVLHSMFNFLYRRTDFFYEADPGDKMGFLPGYSKQLINKIFDQYQDEHFKRFAPKNPEEYAKKLEEYKKKKELEKLNQNTEVQQPQPQEQSQTATKQATTIKSSTATNEEKKDDNNNIKTTVNESQENKKQQQQQNVSNVTQNENKSSASTISTYNGGETDKYKWSQSITDVTVEMRLPRKLKSKELNVELKTNSICVMLRSDKSILLQGELYEKIKVDDSTWNLDEDILQLTLEKGIETIWKTIIKGDQEIDATKVENSKPLDSFDSETQGALRKIMYEQQRKQMGLPTTDEEKQMESLKAAWNAEGSPFKGQPFDPSKFNLAGGNGAGTGGMNFPPMMME